MELTVTVKAEAGATERSGNATAADSVNKAEISRLFMGCANKKNEKMRMEIGEALMQPMAFLKVTL
jgi:hypothetical protein